MSFDLIFCTITNDNTITASSLFEYFKTRKYMECSKKNDELQAMYQNPTTGVYAIFNFSPVEKDKIQPELKKIGATGLDVSINYLRPSFFALEVMPEVETLCKAKKLLVFNPQEEDKDNKPKPEKCDIAKLIKSWEENNLNVAIPSAVQSNIAPPYLEKEKSLYLWKYMYVKEGLEKKFHDDIFVPQIVVLRRASTEPLITAITWADGIPTLLPKCDFIILQKIHTKGFLGIGKKEEIGLIKYDSVNRAIRQYLRTYIGKEPFNIEIPVLYPNNHEKARAILMKLPLEGSIDGIEGIAMDGFIDMKTV